MWLYRYGVKGVVYLQDKVGLVAQPAAFSEAGHCSVAFASGKSINGVSFLCVLVLGM